MKNIISCRPSSYGRYRDKAYEHLSQIGVTHVEIPMPKPEDVDKVLGELSKYDLAVGSIQAPCEVKSENVVEDFRVAVEVVSRLGANRIFTSVHTGGLDKSIVYERLRRVGDVAAEKDVIVIMETHPDLVTNGDVGLETMKGVDHPNIRINFDTANIYYYNEGVDGIEEMKKVLDYIEGVHLKDTNGKPRTWYFPTLGEGIVDFKKVRELLNARGFYGPFTIENEGIQGENLTLEQTLERMEKSVQHLRECGY
jgi:sugar phosphate isomerase/epimerase